MKEVSWKRWEKNIALVRKTKHCLNFLMRKLPTLFNREWVNYKKKEKKSSRYLVRANYSISQFFRFLAPTKHCPNSFLLDNRIIVQIHYIQWCFILYQINLFWSEGSTGDTIFYLWLSAVASPKPTMKFHDELAPWLEVLPILNGLIIENFLDTICCIYNH